MKELKATGNMYVVSFVRLMLVLTIILSATIILPTIYNQSDSAAVQVICDAPRTCKTPECRQGTVATEFTSLSPYIDGRLRNQEIRQQVFEIMDDTDMTPELMVPFLRDKAQSVGLKNCLYAELLENKITEAARIESERKAVLKRVQGWWEVPEKTWLSFHVEDSHFLLKSNKKEWKYKDSTVSVGCPEIPRMHRSHDDQCCDSCGGRGGYNCTSLDICFGECMRHGKKGPHAPPMEYGAFQKVAGEKCTSIKATNDDGDLTVLFNWNDDNSAEVLYIEDGSRWSVRAIKSIAKPVVPLGEDKVQCLANGKDPLYCARPIHEVPGWGIFIGAYKTAPDAIAQMERFKKIGFDTGYLWIPDYTSLSGKPFWATFVGLVPLTDVPAAQRLLREVKKVEKGAYSKAIDRTGALRKLPPG